MMAIKYLLITFGSALIEINVYEIDIQQRDCYRNSNKKTNSMNPKSK